MEEQEQPEERMLVDRLRPSAEMQLQIKEEPNARERVDLGNCVADMLKEEGVEFPTNFRDLGYISFSKDLLEAKSIDVLKELIGS